MLKARRDAATKVANCLFAAEDAIDAAFARVAELNSALVIARSEAQLSAIVAQDAFEQAASTLSALAKARGEIVETHKRLSDTQTQIGLRTLSWGDQGKPPSPEGIHRLQIVA
jgi:microcompartment protein CcmL/EutN